MQRIHLTISGRVQGVGYRRAAQREANRLGLKGWVRNLFDGRVECLAEGSPEAIEAFQLWCGNGPLFAQVEGVEVEKLPAEGSLSDFFIRR